jgi:hypothetical protein
MGKRMKLKRRKKTQSAGKTYVSEISYPLEASTGGFRAGADSHEMVKPVTGYCGMFDRFSHPIKHALGIQAANRWMRWKSHLDHVVKLNEKHSQAAVTSTST